MSPIAWTHLQRQQVPGPHTRGSHRGDHLPTTPIHLAAGHQPPATTASQLQTPRDAVAARRVDILHKTLDPDRPRHRAPPADRHVLRRRRMDGDAVGGHRAGDRDLGVRRIGDQQRSRWHSVTVDEVVPLPVDEAGLQIVRHANRLDVAHAQQL